MYADLTDEDLMALVVATNHDAFAELVTRHTQQYFAIAYRGLSNRADAEEVVQSSFIKLWQRPSAFSGAKGRFTTWFYRVIINACHDLHRKRPNNVYVSDEEFENLSDHVDSEQLKAEQSQHLTQQQRCLEEAIQQLPVSQRDAINLVVYSELPQREAAQIMGVSLKALESLLVRAKRSLGTKVNAMMKGSNLDHSRSSADHPIEEKKCQI